MKELIKINTNEEGKQLVSARELYLGLGLNKAVWSRWYKTNILENDFFKKNLDWVGVQHDVEGNEVQDFAISLDFAKHIAMMARTEKSHEYRNYFIKCEEELKNQIKPTCIEDVLIAQLQEMKAVKQTALEAKEEATKSREEIQAMREAVTLDTNGWRKETATLINKIANKLGGFEHIRNVREESYKLLNENYSVDINRRLNNKQKNMALEGVSRSKINKVNLLDVIAEDKKLLNGYINIVTKMAIRYGVA
ncbi:antA/AntB antirepressor family protein [Clostridium paraputrificum]|uniref:antA/AntB antirepressor family protein n=1 Tax=Clostridium paraputrificum TaxID=29363 RepID=UPI0034A2149B